MANNRLFIGNTNTKEWVMLAKGFGNGWTVRNLDKLNNFIEDSKFIPETDVNGLSQFFFFTEYDNIYEIIFNKKSRWKKYDSI